MERGGISVIAFISYSVLLLHYLDASKYRILAKSISQVFLLLWFKKPLKSEVVFQEKFHITPIKKENNRLEQ